MRLKLKRKFGITFFLIVIIAIAVVLFMEIKFAFNKLVQTQIAYEEKSNISYKVLLKDKFIYDDVYLDEGKSYIASLIDKFIVDYKYINTLSEKVNYTLDYNIKADLIVYDTNNDSKPVYTKQYVLLDTKKIKNTGRVVQAEVLKQEIDYNEYNKVVNELKKELIPNANLVISFNTKFVGKSSKLSEDIISNKTSSLSIPISQRTINVDLKKNSLKDTKTITDNKSLDIGTVLLIGLTILVLLIVIVYFIIYIIKTGHKKSKYEQKLDKILREFDRAITEATGKYVVDRKATSIPVKDFMELLDVHDNLNLPIVYYKINSDNSIFVIRNNGEVYYYKISSDDFD